MAKNSEERRTRFPWGYFAVSLLPLGLIAAIFALPAVLDPRDSMGPAMLCSLLIGPVGAMVVVWGVIRLLRGDGEIFPALRWIIALPVIVGVIGFALG